MARLQLTTYCTPHSTAGEDFDPVRTIVTIRAGSTSALANVSILEDRLAEPTESFNVSLTIESPQTLLLIQLGRFSHTTVNILDNDRISFEWERESYLVREGMGMFPLQVVSSLAASYDITLHFEVINMSAQGGCCHDNWFN